MRVRCRVRWWSGCGGRLLLGFRRPLTMLEQGVVGEFRGRPMFPQRLHVVTLAIDVTTQLLELLDRFFVEAADEVAVWPSPDDVSITPSTRARLEAIRDRNR